MEEDPGVNQFTTYPEILNPDLIQIIFPLTLVLSPFTPDKKHLRPVDLSASPLARLSGL
jgi:hypothetical protein